MERTTVYLPEHLKAALERAAAAHGITEAEVIRGALVAATVDHAHPAPRLPLFDSGDPGLAKRVNGAQGRLRRVILLDTSGLLAAIDSAQRLHRKAADCLAAVDPPLLLSPFVLAELDYLVSRRVREGARASLLDEVGRGAFKLLPSDG